MSLDRQTRWALVLTAIVLLVAVAVKQAVDPDRVAKVQEPSLRVTAGRGLAGISLTNRESGNVQNCDVTLLDAGARWETEIPGPLEPLDTVSVRWAAFTSNGKPMPAYIGQNREGWTV